MVRLLLLQLLLLQPIRVDLAPRVHIRALFIVLFGAVVTAPRPRAAISRGALHRQAVYAGTRCKGLCARLPIA